MGVILIRIRRVPLLHVLDLEAGGQGDCGKLRICQGLALDDDGLLVKGTELILLASSLLVGVELPGVMLGQALGADFVDSMLLDLPVLLAQLVSDARLVRGENGQIAELCLGIEGVVDAQRVSLRIFEHILALHRSGLEGIDKVLLADGGIILNGLCFADLLGQLCRSFFLLILPVL